MSVESIAASSKIVLAKSSAAPAYTSANANNTSNTHGNTLCIPHAIRYGESQTVNQQQHQHNAIVNQGRRSQNAKYLHQHLNDEQSGHQEQHRHQQQPEIVHESRNQTATTTICVVKKSLDQPNGNRRINTVTIAEESKITFNNKNSKITPSHERSATELVARQPLPPPPPPPPPPPVSDDDDEILCEHLEWSAAQSLVEMNAKDKQRRHSNNNCHSNMSIFRNNNDSNINTKNHIQHLPTAKTNIYGASTNTEPQMITERTTGINTIVNAESTFLVISIGLSLAVDYFVFGYNCWTMLQRIFADNFLRTSNATQQLLRTSARKT
uniref:Uncharacterized protein n=1 Tax=Glossina palpalis gambiensis TaxID=67801 RepID=A0A1B0BFP7_9MUSC